MMASSLVSRIQKHCLTISNCKTSWGRKSRHLVKRLFTCGKKSVKPWWTSRWDNVHPLGTFRAASFRAVDLYLGRI